MTAAQIRILVLTPYLYGTAPGPRTSIELWERVLRPVGITFEYAPFESRRLNEVIYRPGHQAVKAGEMVRGGARRVELMRRLRNFDAVLVYREAALLGPAVLERWVHRAGKPIIYQLDDPLYVPYKSPSNGYLSYLKCFGKVGSIARMSRVVIVNSPQHREFAERHNANVWEIPSVIDESVYAPTPKAPRNGGRLCVGWSGSRSTVANLQVIRGVLADVAKRSDVTLRFVGADDAGLPHIPHAAVPWQAATEVAELRRFDIGLVPLPLNEWTKRKFYVKLVQYMAAGVVPVATPLGANPFVIDEGRTGFLANAPHEWRGAIARLLDDDDLRLRMADAVTVEAHAKYTLAANAEKIVAAFRSITG